MKTYVTTRRVKIAIGSLFFVFLALLIFVPIILFSWLGFELALCLFLLLAWLPIMIFVPFCASLKARLILDGQGLRLESLPNFPRFLLGGFKPIDIAYDRIAKVYALQTPGMLQLETTDGKKHQLLPGAFAENHGLEILQELKEHLSPGVFTPDIEKDLVRKPNSGWQALALGLTFASLVLVLGAIMLNPFFPWSIDLFPTWEKPRQEFNLFIEAYSFDTQTDAFWLVSKDPFAGYFLHRYPNPSQQKRNLPLDAGQSIKGMSVDEQGNPWVWTETSALHEQQGAWQEIPYQTEFKFMKYTGNFVAQGSQGWLIDRVDDYDTLFSIDGATGAASRVSRPKSAADAHLWPGLLRQLPDGRLLVLMNNDHEARAYLLNKLRRWEKTEYSIQASPLGVKDLRLDQQGVLWILTFEGANGWQVKKQMPDGSVSFTRLDENLNSYHQFFVDARERIWVVDSQGVSVFAPQWNAKVAQLQRYTRNNSAYSAYSFTNLYMDSKGFLWAFDDKIIFIDTTQATLPPTRPGWYSPGSMIVLMFFNAFLTVSTALINLWAAYTRMQPAKKL